MNHDAVMVGKTVFYALILPMDLPLHDLPDDVDALKAMVLAMAREQAAKEVRLKAAEAAIARLEAVEKSANERIAHLTSILKVLQLTHMHPFRATAPWWA